MRRAQVHGGTSVPSIARVLLLALPLSPGFPRNEDDKPGKPRQRKSGDAAGGDGHGAICSRFFGCRPKQNGKRWKNGDRYDSRAHEGMRILGQHVARSHAQIRHRDDERQRRGRKERKRKQIALREHVFIQENRNNADE
jgi:hypothetical protein